MEEKRAAYASPRSRRKVLIVAGVVAGILILLAVVIPVYFAVIKPDNKSDSDSSSGDGSSDGHSSAAPLPTNSAGQVLITGGSGSKVKTSDGKEFTYTNNFGGFWYHDPENPFTNGARPQEWSPALNETFHYGVDTIRGVNIGGWLTIEPFISPALYEAYSNTDTPAVDEYTLHTNLRRDNKLSVLDKHYSEFITEEDFAAIAGAGLNFVRIPLPFWAIETMDDEPYYAKVQWGYFLKAIEWARKYGLRINLDFHAVPGSQNGWNHSGKLGKVGFLNGPMGYANAQRALDQIRVLAEFISQPQYRDVIPFFGIMNEIQGGTVGKDQVKGFYLEAYKIVRNAGGGTGEGKGPWVSFHDAFLGRDEWSGFLAGGDRMSLDSHPYLAFGGQSDQPMSEQTSRPCDWGSQVNGTMANFGLANAGEWSNAVTDCGLWLTDVNDGTRYEGNWSQETTTRIGSCEPLVDWRTWTDDYKNAVKEFSLSSMDALQNWFFWTWKVGDSSVYGYVRSPHWSYSLGLENGWMPEDPREAIGKCGNTAPFQGSLQPWQTGGEGAGTITAATGDYAWPPATISNGGAPTELPSYTNTGSIPTLTADKTVSAQATQTKVDIGNGWNNADDKEGYVAKINGCTYLDPWVDPGTASPGGCS
ncbi:glycoside hydrolase family 5 protein [Cylindrobasidium torrendii FP15055 ss-10]|uniref:glucan 1,3-beta-glucosidase n=1 Tax=Cylindrobasidium torrendii FP15055 ss-10 TaxID=1314674 RepID=A0A0D7AUN7_9AGAR|nr:glycoside hydrolase family 5 protein [Cylindrobasidium torrendii FP15055 ss-10]